MNTSLKLTIREYEQMVSKGAFDELSQKIELIAGEIHAMNPAGPRHDHIIEFLTHWSVRNTDFQQVRVRIQSGLSLPDQESLVEPDVLWVKAGHPKDRHPIADEVLLVIEVADSSIDIDRQRKADLYGRAGILEYWVINVAEQVIHVFRDPTVSGYSSVKTVTSGNRIASLSVPSSALDPSELFR